MTLKIDPIRATKVGNVVRRYRNARGMSFALLGDLAETSGSYICQIEMGKTQPGVMVLGKIADALDLTMKERIILIETAGFRMSPRKEAA